MDFKLFYNKHKIVIISILIVIIITIIVILILYNKKSDKNSDKNSDKKSDKIDNYKEPTFNVRKYIMNNKQIDNVLHVIVVLSNPCQFKRRVQLANEFLKRMKHELHINVYVVELAYGDQDFSITNENNPRHLQLRGIIPLWHKENMINLAVKKLLPTTWKAMAWIDADIEFDNVNWAMDTLKVLNEGCDVVQLFSHAIDMDKNLNAMSIFPSFGFQHSKNIKYGGSTINMWHPGYAWACTRKMYENIGGLYELGIIGGGDSHMAESFIGIYKITFNNISNNYKQSLNRFQEHAVHLKLKVGYIPGIIRHYYHGSKKNRKYSERWHILLNNLYDPTIHITYNTDGLLIPTDKCPILMLDQIMEYFKERNEDEG